MYSRKQNYLSAYLCVILYVTSSINAFPGTGGYNDEHDLRYDYYDTSCPNLRTIVGLGVWMAIQNETRMAASLLRLHFHDCFVNGCDASVLLDDTQTFEGEQNALINQNSIRGLDIIDNIKADVERHCPLTVSCADILALAARDGVFQIGGPFWEVSLGRLDGLTANKQSVMDQLPSTFAPLQKIIAQFATKGLDIKDMVALSGSHTIGFAQCFVFRGRLYNFNGTGKPDPCLAPSLLSSLRETCPENDRKSACNLVPLDPKSECKFDNKYYKNILKNEGLLQSDQALMSVRETAELVDHYSKNLHRFLKDFAESMVKLGSLGVITASGGGEVRKHCGCVNS